MTMSRQVDRDAEAMRALRELRDGRGEPLQLRQSRVLWLDSDQPQIMWHCEWVDRNMEQWTTERYADPATAIFEATAQLKEAKRHD
jgi:hypothetical protein